MDARSAQARSERPQLDRSLAWDAQKARPALFLAIVAIVLGQVL